MTVDIVTTFISQLNFPAVTAISALFDNDLFFLLIILFFVFIEEKGGKRNRIVLILASLFILGFAIKYAVHESRPCIEAPSKIPCPDDFSFPSNHATIAFALATAMARKPRSWFYALFSFFTAFTRIYLGVHTLLDVAGGMVLGILGFFIITKAWEKLPSSVKEKSSRYLE